MSRVLAELIPGKSGANFTAEFTGPNKEALERATEWTIYGGTAAAAVEISPNPDGGPWVDSGIDVAAGGVTTVPNPPVCRAVRIAGEAPAATPPVRFLVRHGF